MNEKRPWVCDAVERVTATHAQAARWTEAAQSCTPARSRSVWMREVLNDVATRRRREGAAKTQPANGTIASRGAHLVQFRCQASEREVWRAQRWRRRPEDFGPWARRHLDTAAEEQIAAAAAAAARAAKRAASVARHQEGAAEEQGDQTAGGASTT